MKRKRSEDENTVGIDFFPTLGIPIVAGRGFGPQDTATSPKVGIINQSLARKRFPNTNPIGRQFKADPTKLRMDSNRRHLRRHSVF